MAIDEQSRHRLHTKLGNVLGKSEAATLMELLPPVGWADVATKRDLDALEHKLTAAWRGEFLGLQGQLTSQFRTTLFALFSLLLTLAAIVIATGN